MPSPGKPHIRTDVPNMPQRIPLRLVHPSEENCRLFIERESLDKLRARYAAYKDGRSTVLPDPPILRRIREAAPHSCNVCQGKGYDICSFNASPALFEILAGERRVTAATLEFVDGLPCRVVEMSDEEAYRFILEHNNVAGLTTVELAFRAAEMDRLGFDHDAISEAMGGVSVNRYLTVGALVNPEWFSDDPKLCDPSIVEWFEAASFGEHHFQRCFENWNRGFWDAKMCARRFRKRGEALPLDNAERGFRVTKDINRLVVRGQLDLDIVDDPDAALKMLLELENQIGIALEALQNGAHFGPRTVIRINPTTV